MKKFLASLLVMVLAIALVPQGLFTIDVHAATSGDFTYSVSNGEATITDFPDDYSGALTIPSMLGGYPVTTIDGYALTGCENITSIIIPDSISHIFADAFWGCSALTSITVKEENPNFSSMDGVLFNKDKTILLLYPSGKTDTTYTIPHTVTTIGERAFGNAAHLQSINMGASVLSIEFQAFYGCSGISSITIGNSVARIGEQAFVSCTQLKTIILPISITTIHDSVFLFSQLDTVRYNGNVSDRNNINIGNHNEALLNATWYYNGDPFVTQIELIKRPKLYYLAGELFDPTGTVLRLHFSDGTSEDITIDHYDLYNNYFNTYYCKKLGASSRLEPLGGFGIEDLEILSYNFFDQRIDIDFFRKPIQSVSINDDAKNLVITITVLDNTTHTLTALGFIPRMGDSCPDGNHASAFGELITDQGVFHVGFLPNCDGSLRMEIDGKSSNTLVNGCDWYDMYMEKQWPTDGGNALWNMLSHFRSFNGIITNENIDSIIDYTTSVNTLEITDTSDGYILPNGNVALMGWYRGADLRNAIKKTFAVDSMDLSLSIHYDSKNDRYPVLGSGIVNDIHSLPSLTYKNGFWEMYWAEILTYPYSYARYDNEGRILRFSHGEPIITYGDPTDDMIVDSRDLVLIRKFMANFDYDTNTSTVEVAGGADTNGDGGIDARDLVLLRQYFANYDYDSGSSSVVLGPQN